MEVTKMARNDHYTWTPPPHGCKARTSSPT
uniref:Uncharacterized protein n=1 Tax=Siphoviridae sp. ctEP635 TaxID=2825396 RepID=A0A8S5UWW8_9CAUD|nr:MAG TPA: hypothetical protein [Siphoviridae sp. ctEP635]